VAERSGDCLLGLCALFACRRSAGRVGGDAAVADALLGARLVLIELLIAGPMLAAVSLDGSRTGLVAAYALGLAVALGPVDGI
jgi:hypothetical protein